MHGWIYGLKDGRLHDLRFLATGPADMATAYDRAIGRLSQGALIPFRTIEYEFPLYGLGSPERRYARSKDHDAHPSRCRLTIVQNIIM